ncbi:MAG: tRNA (adenosine(37)-N6)-threonylcarbamoyltransferase complex transferase subunit TsaD [Patescibacteria group bacterium]
MVILGIETSCDETAAAVVEKKEDRAVLRSTSVASSLKLHAETGGIIPEIAARKQIEYMLPVIKQAVKEAAIDLSKDIDAIAVTYGPGLIGSLLVGVETAKTLAYVLNKPIIPVNHMLGHIYANWIIPDKNPPTLPALAMVVSGGHTDLLLLKKHGEIQLLGGTRDDAAGECFDKCARLLGYAYPGGPKIALLAKKGNPDAFNFPRPMIGSHDYDFSFSGLKTAFLNTTKKLFPILRSSDTKIGWQQIDLETQLADTQKQTLYDLCASLEKAIVQVLVRKAMKAIEQHNVHSFLLSGGAAANESLRDLFTSKCEQADIDFFVPNIHLCTDNAAMIAAAAAYNYHPVPWKEVTADPQLYFS